MIRIFCSFCIALLSFYFLNMLFARVTFMIIETLLNNSLISNEGFGFIVWLVPASILSAFLAIVLFNYLKKSTVWDFKITNPKK